MESNTNWSLWLKAPSLKNLSSFTGSWQLAAGASINTASTRRILRKTLPISLAAGELQGHLGPPGHLQGKQRLPPPPAGHARGQCPIEGFRMPWIPTRLLCPAPPFRLLLPFLPSPNLSLFSDRVFPDPKALSCHHAWLGPLSQQSPRPLQTEGRCWAVFRAWHKIRHMGNNNTQMLNRLLTQGWRPMSSLWSRFLDRGKPLFPSVCPWLFFKGIWTPPWAV